MSNENDYLISSVICQLRYIRDNWNKSVKIDEFIRSSNVLRMLLVDDNLVRVWKLCGYTYPIRLRAYTLYDVINSFGRNRIIVAFTGGASHSVAKLALGVFVINDKEAQPKKETPQKAPKLEEMTLENYLKAACMLIGEFDINRAELVKYVANKLGGTHFDFNRKSNKLLEQKFVALDSLHNYKYVDKNIIPLQILAIGQELIASRHIQRLMKRNV